MSEAAARYRQAKAIFLLAQQRPQEARDGFLAEACAGDAALRDEVDALLEEDRTRGAALDQLDHTHVLPKLPPGYRIERELGRGGMGVVWLAERDSGDFKQRVALKLLGFDALRDPDRHARFRAERRILASLEHPHIARLIDGGALADGTPFLAMEFVDGERLDVWAERARPQLRDLLRLFVAICRAVQAAHQRLIVHRDLKPANILVDGYGAPKLLDFGIAKLLDDSVEVEVATGTGMQLLTPRYAAPEQVRGEAITTATDVYALGVILYELLTGSSPYGRAAATPDQLRAICDTEPVRPSQATRSDGATGTTSAAHLRGDLDAILLKCLRKESPKRYRGAAELADDLEAFLDRRPVSARAGSTRYAFGKFVARHRVLVASTTVVFAVLVVAMLLLSRQLAETRRERDIAEHERDRATQSFALLQEVLVSADPSVSKGAELTARQILEAGAQRVEAQAWVAPELRAELLARIADTENVLGMREAALAHLDRAEALTGPNDAAIRGVIAVRRLTVAGAAGEMKEVESQSAALLAQIDAGDSTLSISDRTDVLITRANALNFLGRGDESLALLQRALALLPEGPELARKRLSAHSQLGQNLQNLGRLDEAESHLREALRVSLAQGFDPLRVSRDRNNLAGVLAMQGRFAEAMAEHRLGIADFIAIAGREHPEYGVRLNNLGMTEYGAGEIEQSLQHVREAVALNRERYGPQSHIVAVAEANLAGVLTAAGRFAEAQSLIGPAHAGLLAKYGANSLLVLRAARTAGVLAMEQQDFPAARRRFEACEQAAREAQLEANPAAMRCQVGLAELELYGADIEAASTRMERVAVQAAKLDPRHYERGMAALVRARIAFARGDREALAQQLGAVPHEALVEPWQLAWRDLLRAAGEARCDAAAATARGILQARSQTPHPRFAPLCVQEGGA